MAYRGHMETTSIHITGSQATQLLRMARKGDIVRAIPAPRHQLEELSKSVVYAADLRAHQLLAVLGISKENPLKILVPSDASRRWADHNSTCLQTQLLSVPIPEESFLELRPGTGLHAAVWSDNVRVFIPSPALAIVNGAQTLMAAVKKGVASELWSFLRLLEFIDECCGSYSRDPFNPRTSDAFYDKPGTSSRFSDCGRIASYLQEARGVDGLLLARKAVQFAVDCSGSPMESYIYHGLSLPPRYGGLSLHKPLVNHKLVLGEGEWSSLKHESMRPDFQWPIHRVLAEYLGDKDHASKSARTEDKNRMQDYAITPYTAFPLMYDDVKNANALNQTALMLGREFVKSGLKNEVYRLNRLMRDEGFLGRQRILVGALLPAVARYGE